MTSLHHRHFKKCRIILIYALLFFCAPFKTYAVSPVVFATDSVDINNRMIIRNYIEKAVSAHYKRDKKCLAEFWSVATPDTSNYYRNKWHCGSYIFPRRTYWDTTLRKVYKEDKYLKIDSKEISVVQHPTISEVYGVTMLINIISKKYSDEGYMFMVWDFRNPERSQIHIRTWQPVYINKENEQKLDPNDILTLADFDL